MNIPSTDMLVFRNRAEDRMQRADSQGGMSGDRDSLVSRLVRLQNDVAPDLIHLGVAPNYDTARR